MKNSTVFFLYENFQFWEVKFSLYLNFLFIIIIIYFSVKKKSLDISYQSSAWIYGDILRKFSFLSWRSMIRIASSRRI